MQPLIAKHQFIITRLKELVEKKAEIEEKLPSAEASRYNFDVRTTKLAETLKSLREAGETASILVLGGADHFVPSNRGNLAPLMEELAHSNATVLLPKVLDRSKFL